MNLFLNKIKRYVTPLILLIIVHTSYAQQFKWISGGGAADPTAIQKVAFMCTDPNGNMYALSIVSGSDPITADTFHSSFYYGVNKIILISSYNCNGQMRWAKPIGSANSITPDGITADNLGNVYVAGDYQHEAGPLYIGSDTTLAGGTYYAKGVMQLDTSGRFHWVRFLGLNTFSSAVAVSGGLGDPITVDAGNNAHYFCYIGTGVPLMVGDTSVYGVYDITYNTAGTMLSAVRLDLDSEWYLHGAVIDPATGKLYVYGEVNQSMGLGVDTFFAAAFDESRNQLWWHYPGRGTNDDAITGITLDENKHLHFSGSEQSGYFSFNGDTVTNSLSGDMAVVFATDTNGSPFWMTKFSGSYDVNSLAAITQLPHGKIAAAGTFIGEVKNGNDSVVTPAGEDGNPYLVVVDSAGDVQTIQLIYGDGLYNEGTAITSDRVGNVYIGGQVVDSIWAGTPPIPAFHSVGGESDFFVMKYGVDCSCTSMPVADYTDTGTHTIEVTYTGTTSGLDSVVWNFNDGSATVTGASAYHTYTLAGTYRVCATVYTYCGFDMHCSDVTILCGLPPVASFTDTGMHIAGVTYTGTTSTVDSLVWNFGDGTIDTGMILSHTYVDTGTYHLCLTEYSRCGDTTICRYDTVLCWATPVASYSDTGDSAVGFTYTGTTVSLDSIVWTYGDGTTDTGLTATHTYTLSGSYHVCVAAYTSCGVDSSCSNIMVALASLSSASPTLQGIQVFPNPAQDQLFITGITASTAYRLLGITGDCLQQGILNKGSRTLDIKSFVPGVYILELTPDNGARAMVRVIKE